MFRSKFTVIPIGMNCEVAHQLRELGARSDAYPFDWTVTPMRSVIELVENEFDDFLEERNLTFLPAVPRMLFQDDGSVVKISNELVTPVVCRRYSILFPHDFSVKGVEDLPDVRTKYARRIERFRNALSSNQRMILSFVNHPPNEWQAAQYHLADVSFDQPADGDLSDVLRSALLEKPNIQVLSLAGTLKLVGRRPLIRSLVRRIRALCR